MTQADHLRNYFSHSRGRVTHPNQPTDDQFLDAAMRRYGPAGGIMFDDNSKVDTLHNGAWVMARVWVPNPEPSAKPVVYRHYFNAPLTGNFVSRHEDFDEAWKEIRSFSANQQALFEWLIANSEMFYTLNNVEPCDMAINPERLEEDQR